MEDTTDDGYSPSPGEVSEGGEIDDIVTSRSTTGSTIPRSRSRDPRGSTSDGRDLGKGRSLSKKRKQERFEEFIPQSKKIRRSAYSGHYRKLLNELISDLDSGVDLDEHEVLLASQIGLVTWTSEEKDHFFVSIGRKGIHDVQGIQNAVPTKSIPEIHVFLQLLKQAMVDRHLYNRHHELLGSADIPAAFEVSQDCELALTQAADALSIRQFQYECKIERKRHSEVWLLDREKLKDLDESAEEIENIKFRAANELLNLGSFLELSEGIFMNSSHPEDNWRYYAEKGETPSILCTAFLDFHGLVVSITKRLIQSAIFFTMSRIRASDTNNYTHHHVVRKCDITAAIGVLGIKANANQSWAQVANRCNLDVYEKVRDGKHRGDKLSYIEVENRLKIAAANEDAVSTSSDDSKDEPILQESIAAKSSAINYSDFETSSQYSSPSTEVNTFSDDDIDLVPAQSLQAKKQVYYSRKLAKLQDAYAEALDQRANRQEELYLWEIVGKQPPQQLKLEDMELPKPPIVQRKLQEDLVDWGDRTDYRSPWEGYETPLLRKNFRKNERCWRNSRAREEPRTSEEIASGTAQDKESFDRDDEGEEDQLESDNLSSSSMLKQLGGNVKTKVYEINRQNEEAISNEGNSSENNEALQNSDDVISSNGDSSDNEETSRN